MLKCLLHQTARGITLLLDNNLHEKKKSQQGRADEILKPWALFAIFTRVTSFTRVT